MKKNFMYAMMSTIVLTGAVNLTACSSGDEIVDNPDYNPETNTVKTAITLSIDPNGSANTRMAADKAQIGDNTFRGIQDIWLIPSTSAISASTSTASKIELGSIANKSAFDASTESQKTYTDKEVPVQTSNFLFLGKATQSGFSTSADKLANGYTTNNIGAGTSFTASTVGDISIKAVGIAPVTDGETPVLSTDWTEPANALASYLTNVANATGWAATDNANLQNIRNNFISTGLKAGSSEAIRLTLQSLYNAVDGVDATISPAIKSAITTANLQVKSESASPIELEWTESPTVLKNFPVNLGLPEGAAQYQWNNDAFEYVSNPTLNAANTAVMNIVYPNELYYLTNTGLKATSTKTIEWPKSVPEWTSQAWNTWTNDVKADSKNIALYNNIQYGTALLSTTVKVADNTLYDNAKVMDSESEVNKGITVTENSFHLTGVLIGGQPSEVGWNFIPKSTELTKVVYDSNVTGIYANSKDNPSAKNYTLVFDNFKSDGDQEEVNICLEFTNDSGSDFYGKDGIILKGQTFYIVGKLTPGTAFPYPKVGTAQTQTTESNIVDLTHSYYPSLVNRVFIQDFETIAACTLTAGDANTPGSLGKAFATIPDLRSTNQTLGLSVDLSWTQGLTYNVNLGE